MNAMLHQLSPKTVVLKFGDIAKFGDISSLLDLSYGNPLIDYDAAGRHVREKRLAGAGWRLGCAANMDVLNLSNGSLGNRIITSQRHYSSVRDLDPQRQFGIGRKNVDNLAANRDLSGFVDAIISEIAQFG